MATSQPSWTKCSGRFVNASSAVTLAFIWRNLARSRVTMDCPESIVAKMPG
jgi:hypothetical protein